MHQNTKSALAGKLKLLHFGLMVGCAIMLSIIAAFVLIDGKNADIWAGTGIFAPLLILSALHVVGYHMLGKPGREEPEKECQALMIPMFADKEAAITKRSAI